MRPTQRPLAVRFHAGRAAGGDRHYRAAGGAIAAGNSSGPRGGAALAMFESSAATWRGGAQLRIVEQAISADHRAAAGTDLSAVVCARSIASISRGAEP